ncbi:MAG: hypothetical protein Ct9H90mP15_01350 [Candidatus Neomarinimicrobiota bacterium]|nr:MAG: hypothetical protein Ct9H90mP15_01350 [Candidatus Neomarinimicrobiota bacterium]
MLNGWVNYLKKLGLSVGYILNSMSPEERKQAYACDVTYGTNNEFGFLLFARQYDY